MGVHRTWPFKMQTLAQLSVTGLMAAVCLAGCIATPTAPRVGPGRGYIFGVVTVDAVPRSGVRVRIDLSPGLTVAITDEAGQYSLDLGNDSGRDSVPVRVFPPPGVHCPNLVETVPSSDAMVANFDCGSGTPFEVAVTGSYTHLTGIPNVSHECKFIQTTPARPGFRFSVSAVGPLEGGASGVLDATATGALNAQGQARVTIPINRFGTYRNTITITDPSGAASPVTIVREVVVSGAPNACQ